MVVVGVGGLGCVYCLFGLVSILIFVSWVVSFGVEFGGDALGVIVI